MLTSAGQQTVMHVQVFCHNTSASSGERTQTSSVHRSLPKESNNKALLTLREDWSLEMWHMAALLRLFLSAVSMCNRASSPNDAYCIYTAEKRTACVYVRSHQWILTQKQNNTRTPQWSKEFAVVSEYFMRVGVFFIHLMSALSCLWAQNEEHLNRFLDGARSSQKSWQETYLESHFCCGGRTQNSYCYSPLHLSAFCQQLKEHISTSCLSWYSVCWA